MSTFRWLFSSIQLHQSKLKQLYEVRSIFLPGKKKKRSEEEEITTKFVGNAESENWKIICLCGRLGLQCECFQMALIQRLRAYPNCSISFVHFLSFSLLSCHCHQLCTLPRYCLKLPSETSSRVNWWSMPSTARAWTTPVTFMDGLSD